MPVRVKRIYEPSSPGDGHRVLVDRLWPRGISRERANLDLWAKEIAPSSQLRTWFGHQNERWNSFKDRYINELEEMDDVLFEAVVPHARSASVTLLYAAKDPIHNHANVLKEYLQQRFDLG